MEREVWTNNKIEDIDVEPQLPDVSVPVRVGQ